MTEEEIVAAARDIDSSSARRDYVQQVCRGDLALRRRVEQRLTASAESPAALLDLGVPRADADTETIGLKTAELPVFTETPGNSATAGLMEVANALASGAPLAAGTLLARRYRIQAPMGRGGMGWVLKARDEQQQRNVAVKLLTPSLVADLQATERLRREAQAAASVTHQKLVKIETVDESEGLPFLVMELVDGESLADRLARQQSLPPSEVMRIGCEVAEGLSAAHRSGLIHLDIKPPNILLEKHTGQVRISDFGLARIGGDHPLTADGEIVGTPQYMSPEQAAGLRVDARSDLFSLGVVMYEMCTGISPFRAESGIATLRRVRDEQPPSVLTVRPQLPAELATAIIRLLAKKPAERMRSADELVAILRGLLLAYDSTQFPHIACCS